ncbi:MAG: phosphoribosylaminoimidazolesuccinocarboxamide synthase [Actinomycetota bacterium]
MQVQDVKQGEMIYEGKAKIVYATDNPALLIQHFKDSATAFDGKKKGEIKDKGVANAAISTKLFRMLEEEGVATHFEGMLNDRDMLIDNLDMIKLEAITRNIAAGSLAKRLGYEEGTPLKKPVVEFYYKRDDLGDPIITCQHVMELGLIDEPGFKYIRDLSFRINDILTGYFDSIGLKLIDMKMEFGYDQEGNIVLGDEISPDTCRFWDKETNEKLDKDRFRRDLGGVEEAYEEVLRRVTGS